MYMYNMTVLYGYNVHRAMYGVYCIHCIQYIMPKPSYRMF